MYVLFILLAGAAGIGLIYQGAAGRRPGRAAAGLLVLVATAILFGLMSFWGEMLWFRYAGFEGRFWTAVLAAAATALVAAAVAALIVFLLTLPIPRRLRGARFWTVLAAGAFGAVWGLASWEAALQWLNRIHTGVADPMLGMDEGFYLFTLPFLERAHALLIGAGALAAVAVAGAATMLPPADNSWAGRSLRRWRAGPQPVAPVPPFDAPPGGEPLSPAEPAQPVYPPGVPAHPGETAPPGMPPQPSEPVQPVTPVPPASAAAGEEPPHEEAGASPGVLVLARPIFLVVGYLALLLALGRWLSVYGLLYSRWGVVVGPGWTDVHVRLPAYWVVALLLAAVGIVLLAAGMSRRLTERLARTDARFRRSLLVPAGGLAAAWIFGLLVVPGLLQWLYVAPNEITVERPYLVHNIAFTRRGFDLEKVEVQPFAPTGELTPAVVEANQHLLSEVRLWDPMALQAVFEQFQEFRLYYQMAEIDIDRYAMGDRYRQVLVTAREMEQDNLPRQSQTFVNRHFKYTHGYGVALASAHDFTPDGLPNLLIKDIPPVAQYPELRVDRPEIYYGQHTRDYVVANSAEPEFDYPSGEHNVYSHYAGTGGVPMSNFWRRLVYGWHVGGTRLLFSTYPTKESRVMFRREIRERVATLAPFLDFDRDPYITVVGGRLKWIVDAYTTSSHYPYSDPYFAGENIERMRPRPGARSDEAEGEERGTTMVPQRRWVAEYLHGKNYVRNAVKAVIDAYDGKVTFYVFEPDDPIVRVWGRIYPGLFKDKAEMPRELFAHVRYPEGFLLAQGLVYAKYHMTDPVVFYNQEDLWIRATERYYDDVRAVDPYFVMWRPPGSEDAEFTIIQPFTPKNRQVLIGWVAGLADGENYGRLIAYRFPKDQWVLGTQQVDTKIDQDRFLAAQLALWDQRGSRVIRGNVLVIPIGGTLLYVEPIYLQARAAAYPEMRLVVLMHGDQMSYANTFSEALHGLLTGQPPERPAAGLAALLGDATTARRARDALGGYLRLLGQGRFEEAAAELRALEGALKELEGEESRPEAP